MTFSIVIPVRNGSKYLASTIRSAVRQTRPADEILVVDDDSGDCSAAIAKCIEWKERVKYFYNPEPTGFADAWNRAVCKATGDFVSILHQDDLLDQDFLANMEAALRAFPAARHAYASCRYIDGTANVLRSGPKPHRRRAVLYAGNEYARRYLQGVWMRDHIHRCPGVLTERNLLLKLCAYRKEAGHIADDDFFYRVGQFTSVAGVSQPMASYREHENSTTGRAKLLPVTLARDYIFQVRHRADRTKAFSEADELLLEKLAVRAINEALYYTLVLHLPEWREVLALANEFESVSPGAMDRHLPAWSRPLWGSTKGHRMAWASLYAALIRVYRGAARRFGELLTT